MKVCTLPLVYTWRYCNKCTFILLYIHIDVHMYITTKLIYLCHMPNNPKNILAARITNIFTIYFYIFKQISIFRLITLYSDLPLYMYSWFYINSVLYLFIQINTYIFKFTFIYSELYILIYFYILYIHNLHFYIV